MSNSRDKLDSLYVILRGMIREEIDELSTRSDLPSSLRSEVSILGAVLLDNTALEEVKDLSTDELSTESHVTILETMRTMYRRKQPIDLVTLANELGEELLMEVGGMAYLASLTEGLPRKPRVDEYMRILKEKAKLRRIMTACKEATEMCEAQSTESGEIVAQLGVALKGIRAGGKKS